MSSSVPAESAAVDAQIFTILPLSASESWGIYIFSRALGGRKKTMNLESTLIDSFDFAQDARRLGASDTKPFWERFLRSELDEAPDQETAASPAGGCVNSTAGVDARGRPERKRLEKLEREFIGRIIADYEHAVEDGLPPNLAIASLLEWISRECPRLLP